MFNPFKKKAKKLLSDNPNEQRGVPLNKSQLDALFYLLYEVLCYYERPTDNMTTKIVVDAVSMLNANAMLNVVYIFHHLDSSIPGPVCLKRVGPYKRYMFLHKPWEDENPFIHLLELMPYIIYTGCYYLNTDEPVTVCGPNETVVMENLRTYYNACVEYILSMVSDSKLVNKTAICEILQDEDLAYLTTYCDRYVRRFKDKTKVK